ncbi:LOW QUALITY PROTEIN: V-set domain-containing T-cell activation inhibitor 1 [Lathamus discolor]|uniref:LOW QUALITY PROTEIN: V-set domain-containing T-cell activation inhibitor 1 n=1 Tax=Lathamus discolor TaxID=678569 RepID=UPI0032B765F9
MGMGHRCTVPVAGGYPGLSSLGVQAVTAAAGHQEQGGRALLSTLVESKGCLTAVVVTLAVVTVLIIGFGVSGQRSLRVTALPSPGIIGQRGGLGCAFQPDIRLGSVATRWGKAAAAGLVHEFRGGQDQLPEQAALFQGRTAVCVEPVMGGNASLELREVRLSDAGTYQCSVSTASGSGAALLRYRTGAFSTPRVHVESSSSGDTVQCEAPCWFPHPTVRWTAYSDAGEYLPHVSDTSYELNAESITLKVVSFLHNVTANTTYTCVIENSIAKATGDVKVTDFNITRATNLQLVNLDTESVSSSLPTCHWMLLLPLYLLLI